MVRTWTPDTDTPKPDGTDYSTVKAWLNRYREAEKRYYLLSDRLAEAQEATQHITQNISAAPAAAKMARALPGRWNVRRKRSAALMSKERSATGCFLRSETRFPRSRTRKHTRCCTSTISIVSRGTGSQKT